MAFIIFLAWHAKPCTTFSILSFSVQGLDISYLISGEMVRDLSSHRNISAGNCPILTKHISHKTRLDSLHFGTTADWIGPATVIWGRVLFFLLQILRMPPWQNPKIAHAIVANVVHLTNFFQSDFMLDAPLWWLSKIITIYGLRSGQKSMFFVFQSPAFFKTNCLDPSTKMLGSSMLD